MRGLSPEEQALWAKVTETIRPLSDQELAKSSIGAVDEVAEDVNVAAVFDGGDLDPGDQAQAKPLARESPVGNARRRVVIRDGDRPQTGACRLGSERLRRQTTVRRRRVEMQIDHGSGGGLLAWLSARLPAAAAALPLDERAVLADEELEVGAFLRRELEKDLLAFRILEPLAVALEELV